MTHSSLYGRLSYPQAKPLAHYNNERIMWIPVPTVIGCAKRAGLCSSGGAADSGIDYNSVATLLIFQDRPYGSMQPVDSTKVIVHQPYSRNALLLHRAR
jgi:hypothetical protein